MIRTDKNVDLKLNKSLNKKLVAHRFRKSLESYKKNAPIQSQMVKILLENVSKMFEENAFKNVLEIGIGAGTLTEQLIKSFKIDNFFTNDLVSESANIAKDITKDFACNQIFLEGDIEQIDIPSELDLIISNATFQWLTNLTSLIEKLKRHLNSGGIIAFTTFGKKNLKEVAEITNASLEYLSTTTLKTILIDSFPRVSVFEKTEELFFDTPLDVLRHLKKTGVTGIQSSVWTKEKLRNFENQYESLFKTEKGLKLTYNPIFCLMEKN
ncbi:MAG: malonyl-ACP O-methyltransferase BioC [Verrucomicrobiota bacterium]|nr:malonyl-ACP O-methyltransferase BioC [Verrucomicrobiota bacterium]